MPFAPRYPLEDDRKPTIIDASASALQPNLRDDCEQQPVAQEAKGRPAINGERTASSRQKPQNLCRPQLPPLPEYFLKS
jgi:hypothetical protein